MMMNKRLIDTVSKTKKIIALQVALQWLSLVSNIGVMAFISYVFVEATKHQLQPSLLISFVVFVCVAMAIRFLCSYFVSRCSYESSRIVKTTFREKMLRHMLRVGKNYGQKANTSEIVQVAVEGIDQLETYFGQYLPQLFYAMIAPLTLFLVLAPFSLSSALILFLCVPLIPVTIVMVQRWAKKLLSKYWGQYTALGDIFLENLQGLTTTKIYQSDEYMHQKMNKEAETFRRITMKVLTMQLNSIIVMDLIAYGGAALGMIVALMGLRQGTLSLFSAIFIILLAADFFLPMRLLGSYFHIAMNGMAASDKMFRLLDMDAFSGKQVTFSSSPTIELNDVSFGYEKQRTVLNHIHMTIAPHSFIGIIGESGCGKSTLAHLLIGKLRGYQGSITLGGVEISELDEASLNQTIAYIGNQSMLFKGSVRSNLQIASKDASEEAMWDVLTQVNLADFLREENGLDTVVLEKGSNFSGGQRQRLALARALLASRDIYIFDEATSNIDSESEQDIMAVIEALTNTKTVILISHRLANVRHASTIYVLDQGRISEQGTFESLCTNKGPFQTMWEMQSSIENFLGKETLS